MQWPWRTSRNIFYEILLNICFLFCDAIVHFSQMILHLAAGVRIRKNKVMYSILVNPLVVSSNVYEDVKSIESIEPNCTQAIFFPHKRRLKFHLLLGPGPVHNIYTYDAIISLYRVESKDAFLFFSSRKSNSFSVCYHRHKHYQCACSTMY